jgi:hypothetical protein
MVAALSVPSVASASSRTDTQSGASVTQYFTLYYNTGTCRGATYYGITSWQVHWYRGNTGQWLSSAQDAEGEQGALCSNGSAYTANHSNTFYPTFSGNGTATWSLTLNWPNVNPSIITPTGAWVKGNVRDIGGPLQSICTRIDLYLNGDCS